MRKVECVRKINEMDIKLVFGIDGEGRVDISMDVLFMIYMFDLFIKYG